MCPTSSTTTSHPHLPTQPCQAGQDPHPALKGQCLLLNTAGGRTCQLSQGGETLWKQTLSQQNNAMLLLDVLHHDVMVA